jgi:hypothetical protein
VWLVSAGLLSSLAVSSASDQTRPAAPGLSQTPAAPGLPPVAIELDSEIGRLAARTHAAALAHTPARNPFTFADRRGPERRASEPRTSEPRTRELRTPEPPNIVPVPSLAGVADLGAGGLTAVVSLRDALHYVKKGDVIDGRYRVDNVSVDGVDVFDLTLGTVLRLSLQL